MGEAAVRTEKNFPPKLNGNFILLLCNDTVIHSASNCHQFLTLPPRGSFGLPSSFQHPQRRS